MASPRKRIGELLVAAGVIDALDLQAALAHQRQWGGQLGATLIDRGFITESALAETLADQLKLSIVRLADSPVNARALELVPARLCEQLRVFPFRFENAPDGAQDLLVLAMVDPTDRAAIDQVKYHSGRNVLPALAADQDIGNAIRRYYHGRNEPLASIPPARSTSIDPFSDLKSVAPRPPPSMMGPPNVQDSPISVAIPLEEAVESGEFSFPSESTVSGSLDDIPIDVEGFDEDLALAEPAAPVAVAAGFQEIDPVAEGWLTPAENTGATAALLSPAESTGAPVSFLTPAENRGAPAAAEPVDDAAAEWESVAPQSMAPSNAGAAIDWGPLDEGVDLGEGWDESSAPMSIAAVPWAEEPTDLRQASAAQTEVPTALMAADDSAAVESQMAVELDNPFEVSEADAAMPTVRVALGTKAATWIEPQVQVEASELLATESTPEGTEQPAPGDSDWTSFVSPDVGAAALWATAPREEETQSGVSLPASDPEDWSIAGAPGAAAQWATSSTLTSASPAEVRREINEATVTYESLVSPPREGTPSLVDEEEPVTIAGRSEAGGPIEAPLVHESTNSFAELQAHASEQPLATPETSPAAEPLLAEPADRVSLDAALGSTEIPAAQAESPAAPMFTEAPIMQESFSDGEIRHVPDALLADESATDGPAVVSWAGPATDWALGITPASETIGAAAAWASAAPAPVSTEAAPSPVVPESAVSAETAAALEIATPEVVARDHELVAAAHEEVPQPVIPALVPPVGAVIGEPDDSVLAESVAAAEPTTSAAPDGLSALDEALPLDAGSPIPSPAAALEVPAAEPDLSAFAGAPLDEPTVAEAASAALDAPLLEAPGAELQVPGTATDMLSEAVTPGPTSVPPGMTPAPAAVHPEGAESTPPARVTFPPGKGPPLVEEVPEAMRGWRRIGIESPTPTDAVQVMGALVDLLVSRGAFTAEEIAEALRKLREKPQ